MASLSKEKMEELVRGQLQAYNERNLERFCTFFSEDVEVFDLEKNQKIFSGMGEFRKTYSKRFSENPNLHCELKSRVVLSQSILDEEWVTGVEGAAQPSHLVAIYKFNQEKIAKVFFTR